MKKKMKIFKTLFSFLKENSLILYLAPGILGYYFILDPFINTSFFITIGIAVLIILASTGLTLYKNCSNLIDNKFREQWLFSLYTFFGLLWVINLFFYYAGPLIDSFPFTNGYILNNTDTTEFYALFQKILTKTNNNPAISFKLWGYLFLILPCFLFFLAASTYYFAYKKRGVKLLENTIVFLLLFVLFLARQIISFTNHDWTHVNHLPVTIVICQIMTLYVSLFYLVNCYRLSQINRHMNNEAPCSMQEATEPIANIPRKLFFLLTVLFTILIGTMVGYYVSREIDKEELIKKRKTKLDNYYSSEFNFAWNDCINPAYSKETRNYGFKKLEETEAHMLQDGYNRAEIQELSSDTHGKVRESIRLESEKEKTANIQESKNRSIIPDQSQNNIRKSKK